MKNLQSLVKPDNILESYLFADPAQSGSFLLVPLSEIEQLRKAFGVQPGKLI
jgi:hypothetical protein